MQYDTFITHSIDMYMGKPKSGKTLIAGSYPKPLLYLSAGDDGGGRVLANMYRDDVDKGLIKVINLRNDKFVKGQPATTSCDRLASVLAELRQPGADKFKTIVVDTIGALQDDYIRYMSFQKGNKRINVQEYGDVQDMMLRLKDNMKRFSEEMGTIIVWCTHTRELEVYETSGLNKEIRIIPDLTVSTGTKFMRDASNIFYCCRKTVNEGGGQYVKFLVFAGPHPAMDTGTRDVVLKEGEYIEDFTYSKWQEIIKDKHPVLDKLDIVVPDTDAAEEVIIVKGDD